MTHLHPVNEAGNGANAAAAAPPVSTQQCGFRALRINDLAQPAWAAALHAARILRECNPNDAEDRARFRVARNRLVELLPAGADASDIIAQAVRWYALEEVARACLIVNHAEFAA